MMTISIRSAGLEDLERVADLLLAGAQARCMSEPGLWKLESNPREKILSAIRAAKEAESPPFRQQWLVAETGRDIVGVTHSILLPVPPIYAGELGPPGLIMEDCFIAADAPPETRAELFRAAEADLAEAGAQLLLASSIAGGDWEGEYTRQGLVPITLYFAKSGLSEDRALPNVRQACEDDVADIITSSATNRQVLEGLHPIFWKPHPEADTRFGNWMKHSLTLTDRDMLVSEVEGELQGYAISQPATRLHFPIPHDISTTGVIDDYFHKDIESVKIRPPNCDKALALLEAVEAARQGRGDSSILVVCPALWRSKIAMLEKAGYSKAITWFIKINI